MEKGLGGQKHSLLLLLLDRTLVKTIFIQSRFSTLKLYRDLYTFASHFCQFPFFLRFLVTLLLIIYSMILAIIGEKIYARIYLIYDTQDSWCPTINLPYEARTCFSDILNFGCEIMGLIRESEFAIQK